MLDVCQCNAAGSLSSTCDVVRRQCDCKSGVGGRQCDRCLTNFWGFGRISPGPSLAGCIRELSVIIIVIVIVIVIKAVAKIFVREDSPSPSLPTLFSPPFPSLSLLFFPFPSRRAFSHYQLGGLGEHCKLPQRGPGSVANAFLGIFAAQKRI